MIFTVDVTERAERDVSSVLQWLRERSPRGAANWLNRYHHALRTLRANADGFGLAPEADEPGEDLREITFKTRHGNAYRIVFIIRGEIVHVLRVRSTAQALLTSDELEFPE
jgi:plasmid stabilization system protein ParE